MIRLGGFASLALLAAAAPPQLPPYAKALRCAGLLEASVKRLDPASAKGRVHFDAGIFWSMAAADAARAEGHSAARFEQDQLDVGAAAGAQLDARDPAAAAALDACLKAVPPLKP